ncbi:M949_RS01915 family surface polysaccharide biosynthesis protein [Tenacibaculum finnmarkense]|uniref:Uncharacterized protein n=1 Tax=Tenacibaculum finnmarkense genomovar finnmarkense TaxID=1458503 RepID=A0AAP1WHE3_9FLAO|nr:hypothetical protein [Tenacibaculum finnmarkense]MBE7653969.1 hypothetical protein [Tenacibaculum finnmarkense genomovar finnmarkense]MBE7696265.1 hypothetical protein [Tenacibaculum finnmarkense genomovar finnmarkense]
MNRLITTLFLLIYNFTFGQNSDVTSKQLSEQEIDSIFTIKIKDELQLDYPIFKVYEYRDKIGKHYIVMTENIAKCKERKECFDSIKTYCYSYENDILNLKWALKDFILPDLYEYSIYHWSKYFTIDDYDKDGIADPIIIYGTLGVNEIYDGRIKILVYYKNKKRAIRHQNGVHDKRNTQVDKQFYELPIEIQNRVKVLMEKIDEKGNGIFPYGWQKAMENNKLNFD